MGHEDGTSCLPSLMEHNNTDPLWQRSQRIRGAYLAIRGKWDWRKHPFCRMELTPPSGKGGKAWLPYTPDEDVGPAVEDVVCFYYSENTVPEHGLGVTHVEARVISEGRIVEQWVLE